ncbi:hypothetical protein B0H12DRAFT_1240187 [Mycena haematopus]|nr:hypothetical protein B0H12DRAFT_1240187 [Mycena haematopus]
MCGKGIFVAYPDLTFDGVAIVSHNYVRLRTLEEECQLSLLQREVNSYGVRIVPFHHDRLQPGVWASLTVIAMPRAPALLGTATPSTHFRSNTFSVPPAGIVAGAAGSTVGHLLGTGIDGCAVENKRVEFDLKLERREHRTDDDARYIALLEETLSQ